MSSNIQRKVGELLKEAFPTYKVVEEKIVKFRGTTLKFDFYLPELSIMVEVQGQQHYTYNKFYHKSEQDLQSQKYRDMLKTEYVVEAECGLLILDYDEIAKLTTNEIKKLVLKKI